MSRSSQARDGAAKWILARDEPGWTDADQYALDSWLSESDMNRVAYLRLEQSWREADRLAALRGGGALAPASGHELADGAGNRRPAKWLKWVPMAMAASLLLMLGPSWLSSLPFAEKAATVATARYDTPVGGRSRIGLSDGSRVELNTASVVRTAVRKQQREVWLDQGEAYFEVAHDLTRPFVVHAGNRRVTVLGTKFSVRRDGDKVTVAVLEGRVRVDDMINARPARSTIITGGDIALTDGPTTLVTAKSATRVEEGLAWRQGMLSFNQDRLSDVVAEFNRYNRKHIEVTGTDAGSIRIGGMFPAAKPEAFARLLRDAYGLKVEESAETIKISD